MFGAKGTTAAQQQQPAGKKPTTTAAPPPAKPAPAPAPTRDTREPARRGETSSTEDRKSSWLSWLIRIFAILLLLFSPLILFFLIAMLINPFWIRSLLGCHNDCAMPLPYIWPILICFLLEVIAALFSIIFADTAGRTGSLIFAIFWGVMLILGVVLFVLSKDWIVLVCAVSLAVLWVLKFIFSR